MSSIKTYEDLEAEEKRLQALLYSHKESMIDSFAATKASLNPFKSAIDTAKSLFTRGKTNPLMEFGVDFGVDVFFRRFILAKAGWFTKIVLPFIIKNYSTYIIKGRHKYKIFNKIFNSFNVLKTDAKENTGNIKEGINNPIDNFRYDMTGNSKDVQQSSPNPSIG